MRYAPTFLAATLVVSLLAPSQSVAQSVAPFNSQPSDPLDTVHIGAARDSDTIRIHRDNHQIGRSNGDGFVRIAEPYNGPSSVIPKDETEQDIAPDPAEESGAWWVPMVRQAMRNGSRPIHVSLDEVLLAALTNSRQIKVFSELPLIRQTAVVEAEAGFDWARYLDSRWDDLSDPVGSSLTVGGGGVRYENQQWTARSGVRRRNRVGGQIDISQGIGRQKTNSNFFVPGRQGTARLILGYTQPLMRGRGRVYNESLMCLAKLDRRIADDEFHRQLQSHLLEVTRAYWALFLERGVLFQKINSHDRAAEISKILKRRAGVDAQRSQVASAEAEVATRFAELIRARTAVKNAEARIRSLVNSPDFGNFDGVELIPTDSPTQIEFDTDIRESMTLAVQYRPEILQALKQIRAGVIRLNMSKHEMLPVLNLITEGYVAGLKDNDIGAAWQQQFNDGQPSYSVGLHYEVPIGNRAAAARHTRKRLETRQLKNQYETTLETVKLEVEIAVREIQTSNEEMRAKETAMKARAVQLDTLTRRWQLLPGKDVAASLALENLLTAQQRLADSEFEFLQSQLTYNLALMNLKRATGLLLQTEGVTISDATVDGLPEQILDMTPQTH